MKPRLISAARLSFPLASALAALFAVSSAQAAVYYWDNNGTTAGFGGPATGTWDSAGTVGSLTLGWGTDITGLIAPTGTITTASTDAATDAINFGTATAGLGAGTITVAGTVQAGAITFGAASGAIVLSGGTAINLAAASTITVNNATNTIGTALTGAGTSLTKAGSGILVLTGTNTYSGATTINAGTLNLGGATSTGSLVSTVLNLGGGTFSYTRTGTNAQNFTTTNITAGANTVTTSLGTQTVGLGSIVRTVGGTLNVGNTGTITTGNTNTNGIIGGWATVNSDNWATKSGANIAALGVYTAANVTAATNLNTNMDAGTVAIVGVINTNSIRFSGASVKTLTLAAGDNIIQSGGILVRSDVGSNVQTITGGNLLGSSGGDLIVHAYGGLTIASLIKDNGGATALTKTGSGTLTLSNASNSYSGGTFVNAGTLYINSDGNLGNASGGITFNGTSTLAMDANVNLGAGRTLTVNDGASVTFSQGSNGNKGISGVLTGSGSITWGTTTDIWFSNVANTFNGVINVTGTGNTGTAPGGYYGFGISSIGDSVGAGLINLNNASGNFIWRGKSGTTTLSNRQFNLMTSASIIAAGGSGTALNGGDWVHNAANNLIIGTDLLVTGAGAKTLTLKGANTGANTFAGKIADGVGSVISITKNDAGTWILSNTGNSYTGGTTVTGGILQLGASNVLPDAGLVTVAGGTLNLSTFSDTVGAVTVSSGTISGAGTLTGSSYSLSNSATISVALGGSGINLTKTGAGILTLSAANIYTGTTTVSGGTLTLNGTAGTLATPGIIITSGGTFTEDNSGANYRSTTRFTNGTTPGITLQGGRYNLTGSTAAASPTVETIAALTLDSGANTIAITQGTQAGISTLLTASSLVRNNNSTALVIGSSLGQGSTSSNIALLRLTANPTSGAGTLIGGAGTIGGTSKTVSIVPFLVGDASASAPRNTTFVGYDTTNDTLRALSTANEFTAFTTGTTNLTTAGATDNVRYSSALTANAVTGSTVNSLIFDQATATGTVTHTLTGTLTPSSGALAFGSSAGTARAVILTGGTLQFAASDSATSRLEGIISNTLGTNVTINSVIAGTGGVTFSNYNAGSTFTIGGTSNSYSGTTTVNGGTLFLGTGTAGDLGSNTSGIVLNGAANLNFTRTNAGLSLSNNISGNGSVTQNGVGGTTVLSGTNSYTGTTLLSAGTLTARSNQALGASTAPLSITTGATAPILDLQQNTTAYNTTLTGALNATININATASTPTASHTLGTLAALTTGATLNVNLGSNVTTSGTLTFGTVNLTGASSTNFNVGSNATLVLGELVGGNAILKQGSGTLVLNTATTRTNSGGNSLVAGTLRLGVLAAIHGNNQATHVTAVSNNPTLMLAPVSDTGSATAYLGTGGTITNGTGTFTINTNRGTASGAGIINTVSNLTFSGAGSANLTVVGGDLVTSGTAQLNTGLITLSGNSIFTITNPTNGGTTLLNAGGITGAGFGVTLAGNGNFAQTAAIAGALTTVTLGSTYTGTATFNQTNTYSGVTTVNAGTLKLDAGGSIANSPNITVASNATFDVSTRTSSLSLGSGQTLTSSATGAATTATVRTLSTKNLTLSAGGLAFSAYGGANGNSATNAPLTVTGTTAGQLQMNSAPVTVTTTSSLAAGDYVLVAKSGSATVSGTPGTLTVNGSGASGTTSLAVTGGQLILTVSVSGSDYDTWGLPYGLASGSEKGDLDGDGLTNFEEYAFGLIPNSGASVNPISQQLDKSTGLFKYTRRATPATTGVTYTYESSTTLADGSWSTFTPDSATSNSATPTEEITVDVPNLLLAEPKLFIRVKAMKP